MKRIYLLTIIAGIWLFACNRPAGTTATTSKNERMLMATLYQQRAAETEALYHQAYNIATIMVHDEMRKSVEEKRALITDIDETVLDNSPYQAKCILEGINYPEKWDEWCRLSEADALPGSQRFLNFVAAQGIEIFYVTNRREHLKEATIENLKRRGFPNADPEHLFMRTTVNSKEDRRNAIDEDYRIIMLLGDNLEDFTNAFENKDTEERGNVVEKLYTSFGRRFIVFPNPMYGSWENAIYDHKMDTTQQAKSVMRLKALESF